MTFDKKKIPMKLKTTVQLSFYFIVLFLLTLTAAGDDSMPPVFEFHFPHLDSIRIYSGPVSFTHTAHFSSYRISCIRCHHSLESGAERVDAHCKTCHKKEGFPRFEAAEMLTEKERNQYYLVALHNQCIGCHIDTRQSQRQSDVPISCTRCHLR